MSRPRKKQVRDDRWLGYYRQCYRCGKAVNIPNLEDWVYARGTQHARIGYERLYFCSWRCMRAYDKEQEKKGTRPYNAMCLEGKPSGRGK